MSGPKCSTYDAAAARRQRELDAAMRVLAAANDEVDRFNRLDRKSAESIYKIKTSKLSAPSGRGSSPDELRRLAAEVHAQVAQARAALDQRCGEARQTVLHGMFANLEAKIDEPTKPTERSKVSVLDVQRWVERIERAIDDLPAQITEDERQQAIRYASMASDLLADPNGRADEIKSLVSALNRVAHEARTASEARARELALAMELRDELLHFDFDEEGQHLAAQLDAVIESGGATAVADGFADAVARYKSRRAKEVAEQDRALVLQAAREVLAEQGFDLGAETEDAGVVDWLATTVGSETALRVRERSGELQFNLVRIETASTPPPGSTRRAAQDEQAEVEWCETFEAFRNELQDKGIDMKVTSRMRPGERAIHAMTPEEIESALSADARQRATATVAVEEQSVAQANRNQTRERRR